MGEGKAEVGYQSETAKIFVFIQIARESLQWDESTGMTMAEKAIDGFLAELFEKWKGPPKGEGANHLVSIILFCRRAKRAEAAGHSPHAYEDQYSVVVDWEMYEDWQPILCRVRKEAMDMLQVSPELIVESRRGNTLEALHLALMIFDRHHMDRDLSKTGMSIICVLPSGGLLEVPRNKFDLVRLAKRRVLDSGIWLQLICLGEKPLHCVPLIIFTSGRGEKIYHPYWMNIMHYEGRSQWEEVSRVVVQDPDSIAAPSSTSCSYESVLSMGSISEASDSDPCTIEAFKPRHCLMCSNLWSLFGSSKHVGWDMLFALPVCPLRCPITLSTEDLTRSFELVDSTVHEVSSNNLLLGRGATVHDIFRELVELRVALGFLEVCAVGLSGKFFCLSHEIHRLNLPSEAGEKMLVEIYRKRKGSGVVYPETFAYSADIKAKNHPGYRRYDFLFNALPVPNFPWLSADRIIAGEEDQSQILQYVYWQSRFVLIPTEEAPRESLIMATVANEIFDDEELRIAGFFKFIEAFQKIALSRATNPTLAESSPLLQPIKEKDLKISAMEFLKISLTTASCSAYAQQLFSRYSMSDGLLPTPTNRLMVPNDTPKDYSEDDDGDPNYVGDVEPLRRDSEITKMAVLMQHPLVGLNIKNRRWHWRIYRNVFVGSEAVDWILKFFDDVSTREEAVELGNVLIDAGVWDHIFGTHRFLDGYYYYRFSPSYDLGTLRKSDPFILRRVSSTDNTCNKAERHESPDEQATVSSQQRAVVMSRCVLINVTGGKRHFPSSAPTTNGPSLLSPSAPHKQEWAILHYDSSHNPKNAYHFRLHWLTCSARLVDDLIQSWSRRAAQCGFVLVEAPVESNPPLRPSPTSRSGVLSAAPFNRPLAIRFSVRPPSVSRLNEQLGETGTIAEDYFIAELLRRYGFVLDFESDDHFPSPSTTARCVWSYKRLPHVRPQYIHQTGVAIVQIAADDAVFASDSDGDGGKNARKDGHTDQEQPGEYLLWSTNRLLLSAASAAKARSGGHQTLRAQEEQLFTEISLLCADPVALGAFWRETLRLLGQTVGIGPILDDAPVAACDDESPGLSVEEDVEFVAGSPESILHRIARLNLESSL